MAMDLYSLRCNLHGACGGKACHKYKCTNSYALQSARSVWRQRHWLCRTALCRRVAICTERVEAKVVKQGWLHDSQLLQSARSVWRQRLFASIPGVRPSVAICTERVEAKSFAFDYMIRVYSCNLHGACGGKAHGADPAAHRPVLQSARSVWRQSMSKGFSETLLLQSARSVWRQSFSFFRMLQSARDVWKVLQYPSTKNPRKFMQTYCIFIHLGV